MWVCGEELLLVWGCLFALLSFEGLVVVLTASMYENGLKYGSWKGLFEGFMVASVLCGLSSSELLVS